MINQQCQIECSIMDRFSIVWDINGRLVEYKSDANNQDTQVSSENFSGFRNNNGEKTDEFIKIHR